MTKNATLLLLCCIFLSLDVFAQRCGFDLKQQQMMAQDPLYTQKVQQMNNQLAAMVQNNPNALIANTGNGPVYQIPVVIHVMHTGGNVGSNYNPTDAQIQSMIDYLNDSYAASWPGYPDPSNGGTLIPFRFVLARRTAACATTTGIIRVNASSISGYSGGGIDLGSGIGVDELLVKNLSRWPNTEYYNIWIVNKINGEDGISPTAPFIAGYAYFAGASANLDGTVMLASQAVAGAITLPHEIGHAFNLYHSFEGDNNGSSCPANANCATDGDMVCDTDPHIRTLFNCPTGTNACTGNPYGSIVHNFMDYSSCQDRFTAGQKTRMVNGLTAFRGGLIGSLGGTAITTSPATACIPTISNPGNVNNAGPRDIIISDASLTHFSVTSSGYNTDGNLVYIDNTCKQQALLTAGNVYNFSVKTGGNPEKVRVYADYNNDGTFQASELIYTHDGTLSNEVHSFQYTVPTSATVSSLVLNQPIRLRVISDRSIVATITECGPLGYGQAEDYSLIIQGSGGSPLVTSVPASLCQGSTVGVVFSANGVYNAGNIFTAQLSNASGSFANPVTLGTLSGTGNGSISATIPTGQTTGTGYRIRVISSSPATTGADNGTNLSVLSRPTSAQVTLSPSGALSFCPGGSAAMSVPATAGYTYQWYRDNTTIPGATSNSINATVAGTYYVDVFNVLGCSRASGNKTVTQSATPAATISPSTTQSLCAGQTINFSTPLVSGQTYAWYKNGVLVSGATGNTYVATTTGNYNVQVINAGGCSSISPTVSVVTTGCAPSIVSLSSTTLCQAGSVDVQFNANGTYNAGNVFTAQLSSATGSFTSPVNIGTLSSTTSGIINANISNSQATGVGYRIRVVSSSPATTGADNGADLTVAARPTSAQATLSNTGSLSFCQGASTTLSVPATAGFSYKWYNNNVLIAGATSNSYVASTAGTYYADVINAAGCPRPTPTKTVVVNALPAATISPNTPQTICTGQTVTFTGNTGTGLTYKWLKNAVIISGATTSSYVANTAGIYTVQVTNASNCTATSAGVTVTAGSCGAIIDDLGDRNVCQGGTVSVNFTATGYNAGNTFTLQLSNAAGSFSGAPNIGTLTGTTGGTITGTIPAGTPAGTGYKLRIVSSSPSTTGPASQLTLKVQSVVTDVVSLCAVTVDDASGKNLLVWNKPVSTNIDSFVIYRNTSTAGVYSQIGAQAYGVFSTYLDNTSEPTVLPQSYYIAAKNSCGPTSGMSVHKTMHLTISKGQNNNTWNLIWNGYEGFPHGKYIIWRGLTATTMSILREVPASAFSSFTDFTAPTGTVFYKVSVGDGPSCNPTARTTANGFDISSNIASNTEGMVNVQIYPNPSNGAGRVKIAGNPIAYQVRLIDITGRILEQYQGAPGSETEFGRSQAAGIYQVEVIAEGERKVMRWLKL